MGFRGRVSNQLTQLGVLAEDRQATEGAWGGADEGGVCVLLDLAMVFALTDKKARYPSRPDSSAPFSSCSFLLFNKNLALVCLCSGSSV